MKRILTKIISLAIVIMFFASCAPQHQYQTRKGKKKLKHYNAIQYDRAQ